MPPRGGVSSGWPPTQSTASFQRDIPRALLRYHLFGGCKPNIPWKVCVVSIAIQCVAAMGYSFWLVYSRFVICSDTRPMRKIRIDVMSRSALMFVNRESVTYV